MDAGKPPRAYNRWRLTDYPLALHDSGVTDLALENIVRLGAGLLHFDQPHRHFAAPRVPIFCAFRTFRHADLQVAGIGNVPYSCHQSATVQ